MDAHDLKSRALLTLVMADHEAVDRLTANHDDLGYVEAWLRERGHDAQKAAWLAPHLRDALMDMTPSGAASR